MSDNNVDTAVIKKTQEMLGKFIKKPVLTEKLLNKPPFRFIHDIINAVIKETGFLDGVYMKAELISDNIKDRDAKINFLQKLIDVMKLTTKSNISAKPSKIVAGHEAEKTNELLQLIGMAIDNKLDYKPALDTSQVQGSTGKTKISSKDKIKANGIKDSKDKTVIRKELNKEKKPDKVQTSKQVTTKKSTTSKSSSKLPTKVKDENFIEKDKLDEKVSQDGKEMDALPKKVIKPLSSADNENNSIAEVRRSSIENNKIGKEIQLTKVASIENSTKEEILTKALIQEAAIKSDSQLLSVEDENLPPNQEKGTTKAENTVVIEDSKESILVTPPEKKKTSSKRRKSVLEETPSTAIKERPKRSGRRHSKEDSIENISEGQLIVSEQPLKDISVPGPVPSPVDVKRQSTFVREESQTDITNRPRTSLRPPSVRPASARPGAPRRRDKNVEIILQPNDQVKLAGINVKLENFESQLEDDGETLIIVENPSTDDSSKQKDDTQLDDESQQGHLVQQILQTQKELVQEDSEAVAAKDIDVVTFNKRQSSARQMDSLRDVIQILTRSINPLGKLMDFLPEDIDSMHMELNMWRDSYIQAASELKKEKSLTESTLEPMKNQLTQINANIKEHRESIDQIRGKILHNTEKIDKLLSEQ